VKRWLPLALLAALSACYSMPKDEYRATDSDAIKERTEFGEVVLSRVTPTLWMHTSYLDLPGIGPIASNGLIVLREDDAVLVDTAWTEPQTGDILRYAAAVLDRPIRAAVITHFHQDKMGGIGALHRAGVDTWAHALTNELAPSVDFEPAKNTIAFGASGFATRPATAALGPLKLFYPGPGHTSDNITVQPQPGVAFAGCLIKGADARSLGNLSDADVANYADAARSFGNAFPDASIIMMSHSAPAGREAIRHTMRMAEQVAKR
jgi:glyoxylase-like metal-dependent hydrolase (beta-lactamase superfamily II)